MRALADRFRGWLIPGLYDGMSRSPPRPSPVDAGAFCRRSSRRRRRPARPPRSGHRETDHYSLRHEHVSCSRTQASRTPRRYKACFAPLLKASRLILSLGRAPRPNPGLRGDDTCWLGASRCSSCFAASQFRCHTVFLKISHYGMQHLDVVWGRSLVVTSLS